MQGGIIADMIEKKIIQIGTNSWGVTLPKAILNALGINPVLDKLGLELENNRIVLKKLPRKD